MSDPAALSLFWWMSHVGEGTLQRLVDATEAVYPEVEAARARERARRLLQACRRTGHLSVDGTSRWRMLAPALCMATGGQEAFWRGGLSPELRREVERAAAGASTFAPPRRYEAPRLSVAGTTEHIRRVAQAVGARFEPTAAVAATNELTAIEARACSAALPSTNLDRLVVVWAESQSANSGESTAGPIMEVLQYAPEHGKTRYFVQGKHATFEAQSRYEAIYFAARGRTQLCRYDSDRNSFECDVQLPPDYALPLCLCSGRLPNVEGGVRTYREVPPELGRVVLERLGQDRFPPIVRWL
jgi:hypothetical protein